ncbi:MAG TPA: hypothetical protein VFV49_10655 [Thermoanaerobaculia bacterium]|nr:hypothetical protein [Thermoanaerobaculia bacterium]
MPRHLPQEWAKLRAQIEQVRSRLQSLEKPSNPKQEFELISEVKRIDTSLKELERCVDGGKCKAVPLVGSALQPLSTPQLDAARRKFVSLQALVKGLGARATEDQKELIDRADELLASPDAGDRLQEIETALKNLEAATFDPCERPWGSAILAGEMGQSAQLQRSYEEIEKLQCHDPERNAKAKKYLEAVRNAPPPVPASEQPIIETAAAEQPASTQPDPASSTSTNEPAVKPAPPRAASPKKVASNPSVSSQPVSSQRGAGSERDNAPTTPPVSLPPAASLALDVWQSAWGDFGTLSSLAEYARRNSITTINLNPGHGVTEATMSKSHAQLSDLVRRLRQGGIEEINYLYAELGYPIGNYTNLLTRYPDLRITTIVDDSEFTDDKKHRFVENARIVKAARLRYSAFITLESAGNSGVSDVTRYWAIDSIDEPIFMSYFGCTLQEQQEALRDFFEYADRKGKTGNVKIAILLGGKKVGRERSCEQELGRTQFPNFLADLHSWAQGYRSYGGIVLETNLRLPLFDVVTRGSSLDRH